MAVNENNRFNEEEDDEETNEETQIRWSNMIFLPFHPVFKLIVLFSVVVKSILGPIQSVYSIIYCSDVMERNIYLSFIKYFYLYCCDPIYGVDTFLHILHRQVTDEAMRREYLPKSAFLLLLDNVSLIPFFRLVTAVSCPTVQLWPNILCFTEILTIYRVVDYFSLVTTHSFWMILIGFIFISIISVNCMTCLFLLLTMQGLCRNCNNGLYDWRKFVVHKLNETVEGYSMYVYATSFVLSFTLSEMFDETKPSTILEFVVASALMLFGYFITVFVVFPKLFAESILRLRRVCEFRPHVKRIIEETRRRNPSPKAHIDVENFYSLTWKKRSGITCIPEVITELPRYLRLDIRQDLVWPVFHHSPTFRKTSTSFKRWICDYIRLDYKLPGEKFFAGPHCRTNLFYLKSGIVQFVSSDDGTSPLLSVTSGTVFGDISFFLPPIGRRVIVRCLTYCEVFSISRADILKCLHKFPEDRNIVIQLAKDRIKHARTLYACKLHVRGLDRAEDEGVAWVKRRWWEISDAMTNWRKKYNKKDPIKCELPPEEAVYHCAKYIGQLVLCTDVQLQKKSLFANVKFPWILVPHSSFGIVWNRIVLCTVYLVLLFYPPNITREDIPTWFKFFLFWTDLIYAADICVSLMTSIVRGGNVTTTFAAVMFARCKSWSFVLDLLATVWIENFVVIVGKQQFYYVCQFNRLIKIYILFKDEYVSQRDIKTDPLSKVFFKIALIHFCFCYIAGYSVYIIDRNIPEVTTSYFFGEKYCGHHVPKDECNVEITDVLAIAISWTFELLFSGYTPNSLIDLYIAMSLSFFGYMIFMFCKSRLVAILYLKYKEVTDYQYFVSNIQKHYEHHKIHPDLLVRLKRYLVCHWRYYQGMDVMHPNLLKDEPYDIYWKVQGEVAVKIISESRAFAGADPALIRELAYKSKFLILPKNATILLFGVQSKKVIWLAKGFIKCEYHNEKGELQKIFYSPGQVLSLSSVFLGKASLRTYTSYTNCETLFIKRKDFFNVIKHYPNEWSYFANCLKEFGPVFEEMFETYVKKHRDYQKKLRENIFHNKIQRKKKIIGSSYSRVIYGNIWTEPKSRFMKYWMLLRAIGVIVSIAAASLQGGSGAMYRRPLVIIGALCDCISLIDIVIKLFMPYYDERGLLIYDTRKCMLHYLSRGFLMDVIGALPWYDLIRHVPTVSLEDDDALLINTVCKFAHLYLLMGYFNYIADSPSVNMALMMIVKWQVFIILLSLGVSHFFISRCIDFEWDNKVNLIDMKRRNNCWLPQYLKLDDNQTSYQLHFLFAQSLNLAQCGLMRINLGKFKIEHHNFRMVVSLFTLGLIFWYVICYSLTLLVLNSRGNTIFQHGVSQLRRFLLAERVEDKLTERAVAHFRYWWMRTKGINIHNLMNERIGVVFRQDLSYYFFKKTVTALDTLLHGGESLERQLASAGSQLHFLPDEIIMREMDLTPWVYILHRGKITISQNGEVLAVLTKGAIFGQLMGTAVRPIRVTAEAADYTDLLQIPIKTFQDILDDNVRENITRNIQSKNDYMALKKPITENPYNTVQYLLRGRKTMKFPWMTEPVEARSGTWYSRWLFLVWAVEPVASAFIVLLLKTLPLHFVHNIYWCLVILDIVHLCHIVSEFFTMDLVVVDGKCVNRIIGYRRFQYWGFYTDALSLLVPVITFVTGNWNYQSARLLRLRLFYDFHRHFCRSFKTKATPALMNFIIVFLLLHAMTCGWIFVSCRNVDEFPVALPEMTAEANSTNDYDEWVSPKDRKKGCARLTRLFKSGDKYIQSFVVPKSWRNDYILSMTYIILIYTHTDMDAVVPLSLDQIYYKLFVSYVIYLLGMWVSSLAISAIYTRFRDTYQYDYNVNNLTTYLKQTGLCVTLLQSVKEYTNQLWQRQRGNWLPELAQYAPVCLREDLLGALYLHHLEAPPLLRQLPPYFTRQLVARLRRVVIFPGKYVVQEGDILPTIYFIHEGEVEKWYTDSSGEKKMLSLLSTNGYFGLIPGLFPNSPHQFSYFTRTVVDLVFLRYRDWQDLLEGYPDVKNNLYTAARQLKKELMR